MGSGLMRLPREIRDLIWRELLLVENNITMPDFPDHPGLRRYDEFSLPDPNGLSFSQNAKRLLKESPFEVRSSWGISPANASLFYVNTKISTETLECFHRENLFVSLQTRDVAPKADLLYSRNILHDFVARSIPLRMNKKSCKPPKTALNINMWQDSREILVPTNGREMKSAVIPGRYLPRLVQIINSLHSPLLDITHWITPSACILPIDLIELDFTQSKVAGSPYLESNFIAGNPVSFLKGLRQSLRSPVRIGVSGLSAEKEEELLKHSHLPAWGAKKYVAEAKVLIEQASTLHEQREYDEAYAQLRIAETMLGFTMSSKGIMATNTNRELAFEATAAMFDLLLVLHRVSNNLASPEVVAALLGVTAKGLKRLKLLDKLQHAYGEIKMTFDGIGDAKSPHSPFRVYFQPHEQMWNTEVSEDMTRNRSRCFLRNAQLLNEYGLAGFQELGQGLRFDPGNKELQDLDDYLRENRKDLLNFSYRGELDHYA